jgi:hypothetical protein
MRGCRTVAGHCFTDSRGRGRRGVPDLFRTWYLPGHDQDRNPAGEQTRTG